MAIELNVSNPLETLAAPSDKASPGGVSSADPAGKAPAGQFNAMLAQFGQAVQGQEAEDTVCEPAVDASMAALVAPTDTSGVGILPGDGQTAVDPSSAVTLMPAMDPLALMSQMQVAAQVQKPASTPSVTVASGEPAATATATATLAVDAAGVPGTPPLPGHHAAKAGAEALGLPEVQKQAQKQASTGRFELPAGMEALSPDGKKPSLAGKLTGASGAATPSSTNALLARGGDAQSAQVSSAEFSEWLAGSLQTSSETAKSESTLPGVAVGTPAHTPSAPRTEPSPLGSWDFSSKVGSNVADVQTPNGASQASFEQQVADQVSVWVSQNVQSAELKMDAFGTDRVEVSITMAGNEATVQFRSDVAETRDLLQRAAANLESALRNDGLVLSGVSVGASTQGQDNAREASQNTQVFSRKPSVKQDTVADVGMRMVARPVVPEGRLDLYV